MRTTRVLIGLTLAACLWAPRAAWAQRDKPWARADKAWMVAMSAYRGSRFRQAEALLTDYVRKYGSTEKTPLAYSYLATCKARLKKPKETEEEREKREKEVDAVMGVLLKRYKGSVWWFAAKAHFLRRIKAKRQTDEFLDYLEKFIVEAKGLPSDFHSGVTAGNGGTWYGGKSGAWFHYHRPVGMAWLRGISGSTRGIVSELEAMADTPARRQRVYKILLPLFHRNRRSIGWQYAHLRQLVGLGRIEDADKAYKRYLRYYPPTGGDPRGIMLRVLWAQFWQGKKDDKRADAIYADLVKNYMGFATLSTVLRARSAHLAAKGRYKDFVALAKAYLKHYPHGYDRDRILKLWLGMRRKQAMDGDPEALLNIHDVLDTYFAGTLYRRRWLIKLYLDMKKPEEALKLAKKFLNDDEWSRDTYLKLRGYARSNKALAVLVEEADEKHGIFAFSPDPNSKPALKLKELIVRAGDDQVLHMEEIGDTLFSKYKKTGEAVEAVRYLVEYYFQKVLPGPRDAWITRMIETYPRHPDTERVLVRQIESLYAGNFFEKMGTPLDLIKKRFPAKAKLRSPNYLAFNRSWSALRLIAYNAADDAEGREKMTDEGLQRLAKAASRGELGAMRAYAKYQFRQKEGLRPDPQARGDHWMKQARKFAGSRAELFCLREAWQAYVNTPYPPELSDQKVVILDDALDAIEDLQTQEIDPEVAWNTQFADVNLLLAHRKVREALYRLKEAISDGKKIRDVHTRLSFGALAAGLAQTGSVREIGMQLVDKKLRAVCFTEADKNWINNFEIWVAYHQRTPESHRKALPFFRKKMAETRIPLRAWGWYGKAMHCASTLGLKASKSVAEQYLQRISRCQGLVPGILAGLGSRAMHPATRSEKVLKEMQSRLERRYGASQARGRLETAVKNRK